MGYAYVESRGQRTANALTGWNLSLGAGTFISSTSFSIPGDFTGSISKGDKVRLKQGGAFKYFYIETESFAASKTTFTLAGNDTYSLANSAITDLYFSKANTPNGFPAPFAYTGAVLLSSSAGSITTSVTYFNYVITDGVVTVWFQVGGTLSGATAAHIDLQTFPMVAKGAQYTELFSGQDGGGYSAGTFALTTNNSKTIQFYKETTANWALGAASFQGKLSYVFL